MTILPTPLPQGLPMAPWRTTGTVVGALLNDPALLASLGEAAHQPPYKAPPVAPVLEVKPRHTWAGSGAEVAVPAQPGAVTVGVSLGIVIGRTACRVPAAQAPAHVAGYVAVADLSLPLDSHYRPAVRLKARDGFCLFAEAVPAAAVADPDALVTRCWIDGALSHTASTAGRVRGVAALLAEVSAIMTLQPGDLLLLGPAHGAPLARIGQAVRVEIEGLGGPAFRLVAEPAEVLA